MRTLLVISVCFSYVIKGLAQPIDSAYLKISYNLNYVLDTTRPYKAQNDLQVLLIGSRSSFTCSQSLLKRDSIINSRKQLGDDNKSLLSSETAKIGLLAKFRILTPFTDNKLTVIDEAGMDKLYYDETKEKINWLIEPDTVTFFSYLCQKAACSYRGRNYIAWFTKDIPVSTGPYKFRGLPGLILSIADTKNNYVFECVGIEKITPKQPINISTNGIIKTSRKDFLKLQKNAFDNPWQMFKDKGITIGGRDADAINAMLKTPKPYNPIELE